MTGAVLTGPATASEMRTLPDDVLAWAVVGRLWKRLAHDSNNWLAMVLGHAELGVQSEALDRMRRSLTQCGQAAELLKQVSLSLGALTGGCQRAERGRIPLGDTVRAVEALYSGSFRRSGIRWECDASGAPVIECAGDRIALALAGLVGLAFDECRGTGEAAIRLRLAAAGTAWEFAVTASPGPERCSGAEGEPGSIELVWAERVAAAHGGSLRVDPGEKDVVRALTLGGAPETGERE